MASRSDEHERRIRPAGEHQDQCWSAVYSPNRGAIQALARLKDRAEKLGSAHPEYYVFPACESLRIDPTKPMKGWKTAWRNLTKVAGLKGLRFHDLRHQAITQLCERGLSDMTVMSIAGHVSKEILAHYSHIRTEAKRNALKLLETPLPQVSQGSDLLGPPAVN